MIETTKKNRSFKVTLAASALIASSLFGAMTTHADSVKDTTSDQAITQEAKDVINGKESDTGIAIPTGEERVTYLKSAGYDYKKVQDKVNELLSVNVVTKPESQPVQQETHQVEQSQQENQSTQQSVHQEQSQPAQSSGSIQDIVHNAAIARGWGDQLGALDFIVEHESGWNPLSQNPTSTAHGLFQMLTETSNDPAVQTENGLNYIASRYGNPAGAYAFWTTHNWY